MDETVLRNRAIELIRAEKYRVRKRKILLALRLVAVGVTLTVLYLHFLIDH